MRPVCAQEVVMRARAGQWQRRHWKSVVAALLAVLGMLVVGVSCSSEDVGGGGAGASGSLSDIAKARGLTDDDLVAAAKTYVPSGKHDEYILFTSGGRIYAPRSPSSLWRAALLPSRRSATRPSR
jgi:hypothetical protein